jgi:hypothetical protein
LFEGQVEGIAADDFESLLFCLPAKGHVDVYTHEKVPLLSFGFIELRVISAAYFKDGVGFYHNSNKRTIKPIGSI